MLGLDAPEDQLAATFAIAAKFPLVKGFAVGRTIFGQPARDWFAGRIDDETAVSTMTRNFETLCQVWDKVRSNAEEVAA